MRFTIRWNGCCQKVNNIMNPAFLALGLFLVIGWACSNKPTWVVRMLTAHLNIPVERGKYTKSHEIAAYVRENPESWGQQYPDLLRLIKIFGRVGYAMFAVAILIAIATLILPLPH